MFALLNLFNRAFSNYTQYFFKLTAIVAFVNGTDPHTLCVIRNKNGTMSQYLKGFLAIGSVMKTCLFHINSISIDITVN